MIEIPLPNVLLNQELLACYSHTVLHLEKKNSSVGQCLGLTWKTDGTSAIIQKLFMWPIQFQKWYQANFELKFSFPHFNILVKYEKEFLMGIKTKFFLKKGKDHFFFPPKWTTLLLLSKV